MQNNNKNNNHKDKNNTKPKGHQQRLSSSITDVLYHNGQNNINKDANGRLNQINNLQQVGNQLNSPITEKLNQQKRGTVEKNYTRSTYLIRNDLKKTLNGYAENSGVRGAKTYLINEALFHMFSDKDYINNVIANLMDTNKDKSIIIENHATELSPNADPAYLNGFLPNNLNN